MMTWKNVVQLISQPFVIIELEHPRIGHVDGNTEVFTATASLVVIGEVGVDVRIDFVR